MKLIDLIERENQISLVLRDSQRRYVLGDGKVINIIDPTLNLVKSITIDNSCGLVHDGYIYIGGEQGIAIIGEDGTRYLLD